jgi:hypothetical protein
MIEKLKSSESVVILEITLTVIFLVLIYLYL